MENYILQISDSCTEVVDVYTPHVVTLFNTWEDDNLVQQYNITILDGVMLDVSKADNVSKSGLDNADSARLYIPFHVNAKGTNDAKKTYLPPKQFDALTDKSGNWTLNAGGSGNSTSTYFVKGIVSTGMSLSALKSAYDYVFDVTSVDIRDFGSSDMQHFQVGGK